MDETIKRNIAKVAMWGALAWASWRIFKGIEKKETASEIVKETVAPITNAANEFKKITKKFLKGSPEAKAHMAAIRAKIKPKDKVEKKNVKISSKKSKFKEFFWKW
jgi:hypothetical protein